MLQSDYKWYHYTGITGAVLMLAGLLFSPAMISIGVVLMFANAFIEQSPARIASDIRRNKLMLFFLVLYAFHLLGYFYTGDTERFLDDIRIKLPLLLLPVGLTAPSLYTPKVFIGLHRLFVFLVFGVGVLTMGHYLMHFEHINARIAHSKPIPVYGGINHIYYGVFLAYSIILGGYLAIQRPWARRSVQIGWVVMLALMVIFVHTIASRTGLVSLYAGMIAAGFAYFILKKRQWLKGMASVALLAAVFFLAIKSVAPLYERYENTLTDLEVIMEGEDPNYWSLAQRYEAMQRGWEVFLLRPFTGVGMGDVKGYVQQQYKINDTKLLPDNREQPHNQFIMYLAGMGIPGFLLFAAIFFYPLYVQRLRSNPYILAIWGVMLVGLMFESMLQRQLGATFFPFIWLYCMGCFVSASRPVTRDVDEPPSHRLNSKS